MARIDLLTVGETFQDLIFAGLRRLPRAGEEEKTGRFVDTIGGGAAITAVAAARLGLRTAIVSALPPGAARRLRRERIAITDLRRRGEPHAVTAALSTPRDRGFATFTASIRGSSRGLRARLRAGRPRTCTSRFRPCSAPCGRESRVACARGA